MALKTSECVGLLLKGRAPCPKSHMMVMRHQHHHFCPQRTKRGEFQTSSFSSEPTETASIPGVDFTKASLSVLEPLHPFPQPLLRPFYVTNAWKRSFIRWNSQGQSKRMLHNTPDSLQSVCCVTSLNISVISSQRVESSWGQMGDKLWFSCV